MASTVTSTGVRRRVGAARKTVGAIVVALLLGPAAAKALAQDGEPNIPGVQHGPCVGQLGTYAHVSVPADFVFIGKEGVGRFLEITQNPSSGDELGAVVRKTPEGGFWFAVFEFRDVGYVKDDEKDSLDAAALLETLRKGNEAGNRERQARGWELIELKGWQRQPFYDNVTHNLTWATLVGRPGGTEEWVNHSVRLLGRGGFITADVVFDPEQAGSATTEFAALLTGFSFDEGQRYAEFRPGDKMASYGLTALVAGGVGAAAVKSGAMGKLWKLIAVGVVAGFAALKRFFTALFGDREAHDPVEPPPTAGTTR